MPERDLIGFVYFFHDVGTGVSGGGPAVWDPSGREVYDCRFYVDCHALRDRTWDPHRPGVAKPGDYLWAIASPEAHWHAITVAGDEPGVDVVMNGHLIRDGRLGSWSRARGGYCSAATAHRSAWCSAPRTGGRAGVG